MYDISAPVLSFILYKLPSAKKGDFKGIKSAISEAKKNPRSQYDRALVRELNTAAYVEKSIPAKDQAEFDRLFNNLKSALQSR